MLRIVGQVEAPVELDDAELQQLGASGAVPVAALLDRARPTPEATHATAIARDDGYRASIPLDELRRGGRLLLDNGTLRLRVVGGRTLCWNVKDVVAFEVTAGPAPDDVPENPPH